MWGGGGGGLPTLYAWHVKTNLQWLSICAIRYRWYRIWLVPYFLDLEPWPVSRGSFGYILQDHYHLRLQDPTWKHRTIWIRPSPKLFTEGNEIVPSSGIYNIQQRCSCPVCTTKRDWFPPLSLCYTRKRNTTHKNANASYPWTETWNRCVRGCLYNYMISLCRDATKRGVVLMYWKLKKVAVMP